MAIESSDSIIRNPFFFCPIFLINFVPECEIFKAGKFVGCADEIATSFI
jgi:hypothetical protein